jgi:hypothetical protein
MANNRLYLYDPETDEEFLLAKGFMDGWIITLRGYGFIEKFQEFLDGKDLNSAAGTDTELLLLTEKGLDLVRSKRNEGHVDEHK